MVIMVIMSFAGGYLLGFLPKIRDVPARWARILVARPHLSITNFNWATFKWKIIDWKIFDWEIFDWAIFDWEIFDL